MAASGSRWRLVETFYITGRTIAIAALGGGLFALLGLPAPLIGGGMLAVAAATLNGVRVAIPIPLREAVFFILGVSIGSALSPESLAGIMVWPASLVILVLGVPLVTVGAALLLIWRGWPRNDALLATAPGALSTVLLVADAIGANVARIALVQTLRLAILVVLLPILIRLFGDTAQPATRGSAGTIDIAELALVGLAALAGIALARLVRLPAASLVGAMLGSGALYLSGVVATPIPDLVMVPGLVVISAYIGTRFAGMTMAGIRAGLVDGLYAFAAAFAISVALAGLVTLTLGLSFGETVLAFAPGGLEVMIVIALGLGLDAAYVALHQTIRFVVIAVGAPLYFRPSNAPGRNRD
jgi:uncharacterized protein